MTEIGVQICRYKGGRDSLIAAMLTDPGSMVPARINKARICDLQADLMPGACLKRPQIVENTRSTTIEVPLHGLC